MPNKKYIGIFFVMLFCVKLAVANQVTGTLLFGDDFYLVKVYCQNKNKNIPPSERSQEAPETPLSTCSVLVFDMMEQPAYLSDTGEMEEANKVSYYYQDRFIWPIDLEKPLPPPKF